MSLEHPRYLVYDPPKCSLWCCLPKSRWFNSFYKLLLGFKSIDKVDWEKHGHRAMTRTVVHIHKLYSICFYSLIITKCGLYQKQSKVLWAIRDMMNTTQDWVQELMKNTLKTEFKTRVQNKITQDASPFMIMVTCVMSITIWIYIPKTVSAVGLLAPAPPQFPAKCTRLWPYSSWEGTRW
jgi:hypothetical protein